MGQPEFDFSKVQGFDWDAGNHKKNWLRHRVDYRECEEVFFNKPLFVYSDEENSNKERRYYSLGVTNQDRRLFFSFTLRGQKIRIISARDQSRGERKWYETQA